MPNPSIIHPESQNIRHFLGLVDLYIQLGKPEVYEIEPIVNASYRPDVYMHSPHPILVEYQRSKITIKKMQEKVDHFEKSFHANEHDAKTLWILSDVSYSIKIPQGFQVIQSPIYKHEKGA